MKITTLLLTISLWSVVSAQSSFIKVFDEFHYGDIFDVDEMPDGGFVLSGNYTPVDGYGPSSYIIRTDDTGGVIWEKTYDSLFAEFGRGIASTPDGNILALLIRSDTTDGEIPFAQLEKLTPDGATLWSKKVSNDTYFVNHYSIDVTSDNGCILFSSDDMDYWGSGYHTTLTKYNADGDTAWSHEFTDDIIPDKGYFRHVIEVSDGYVVATQHIYFTEPGFDLPDTAVTIITKLDLDGNYVSHTSFSFNTLTGIVKCPGGGFYLLTNKPYPVYDIFICLEGPLVIRKLDDALDEVWTKEHAYAYAYPVLLTVLESGNLMVLACTNLEEECTDEGDITLLKFSAAGDSLAVIPFEDMDDYQYRSAMQSNDGHIVVAGENHTHADWPPYLMKVDTTGRINNVAITGKVFYDANDNLVYDAGDIALNEVLCEIEETDAYAATDEAGNFTRWIYNPGTYHVSATDPDSFYQTAPAASYEITIDSMNQVMDTLYFAKNTAYEGSDLRMEIIPVSDANPGFVTYLSLTYANDGIEPVTGITLTLTHPDTYTLDYESIPHSAYADNTVTYNVGDLNGLNSEHITIGLLLHDTVSLGTVIQLTGHLEPLIDDMNPANNYDSVQIDVGGAFDPNEKSVVPEGETGLGFVNPATNTLEYTIRFQNTGTDTAVTVMIIDTLATEIDFASFTMLAASHHYTLDFIYPDIVKWTFHEIMLPDSNANELLSHGFVRYKVSLQEALPEGTQFYNMAGIYFDFNVPVLTEKVFTTLKIYVDAEAAGTPDPVTIYPNPSEGILTIGGGGLSGKLLSMQLITPDGKIIKQVWPDTNNRIDVSALPQGTYIYVLMDGKEKLQSGKIVLVK